MDPFVLDRNFCKLMITCYGIKYKQYTGIYTKENSDGFRQNSTNESRNQAHLKILPNPLKIFLFTITSDCGKIGV